MSTTAGFFDETKLLDRVMRAAQMGVDGRLRADREADFNTVKALVDNTTMRFGPLEVSNKDHKVKVIFPHLCANNAGDYTQADYCTTTCGEPSTNEKIYKMPVPLFDCFTMNEAVFRGNELDLDEVWAEARIKIEKNLLELLSQRLITDVIEPNLGVNLYTTGKGVVAGTQTNFIPAYWNASIVAELARTAVMNKMNQQFLLDSGLLYNQIITAQFNAGNADGVGANAMFKSLRYYHDLFNLNAVHAPDQVMYMIERGAIGVFTKTHLANITEAKPKQVAGEEWRWSENSILMPGFVLDVHLTIGCDPLTDEKVWTYKYILRWGGFVNPTACTPTNTGLLKMVCS